jgi:hypothetical protein
MPRRKRLDWLDTPLEKCGLVLFVLVVICEWWFVSWHFFGMFSIAVLFRASGGATKLLHYMSNHQSSHAPGLPILMMCLLTS